MKAIGLCAVIGAALGCGTGCVSNSGAVATATRETTVTTTAVETTTVSVVSASVSAEDSAQVPTPIAADVVSVPAASGRTTGNIGDGRQIPIGEGVDIFQPAQRPCGTIAADAPKFVDPETSDDKK